MKENIYKEFSNAKKYQPLRCALRKAQTKPESYIWFGLRNKKLGYKFRRQHSIGKYIVDFFCYELKLIIEIDGSDHDYKYEKDIVRHKELEVMGYKIIRYKNWQVLKHLCDVGDDIRFRCEERTKELKKLKL